jgi:hypothetical protein
MNLRRWSWPVGLLCACLLAGLAWLRVQGDQGGGALPALPIPAALQQAVPWLLPMPAGTSAHDPDGEHATAGAAVRSVASPLDSVAPPVLRAGADGRLVLDPQARVDIERVHALYPRDEALARLKDASDGLPAQAQRQVQELYQQYAQYAQALAQAFPPDQSIDTVDEAMRQLQGLHDLRLQHFGADVAEAMYGDEERTSRELIALMKAQNKPGQSLQDKAEAAQEALLKR